MLLDHLKKQILEAMEPGDDDYEIAYNSARNHAIKILSLMDIYFKDYPFENIHTFCENFHLWNSYIVYDGAVFSQYEWNAECAKDEAWQLVSDELASMGY